MDPSANPFAALSLIVAPAILTNAASVLAMSTSKSPGARRRSCAGACEAARSETRAMLLLRVLRSFYTALAGFAVATLVSLLGAALAAVASGLAVQVLELAGVGAGLVAVGAL